MEFLSCRTRSRVPEGDREAVQERFFRPYFLQAPGDMVAHEGRLCRLDCKVLTVPSVLSIHVCVYVLVGVFMFLLFA